MHNAIMFFLWLLAPHTDVDRLQQYIEQTNPRATVYSRELAEQVVWWSDHFGLDLVLVAAVCQTESWFDVRTRGSFGEFGLWQILPTREWQQMPTRMQIKLSRDIVLTTWMAAAILATVRCRRHSAYCYAHYNSGRHGKPRWRYIVKLRQYSATIAAALYD